MIYIFFPTRVKFMRIKLRMNKILLLHYMIF